MKMRRSSITAIAVALVLGLGLLFSLAVPRRHTLTTQPPTRQQRLNYQGTAPRVNPQIVTPRTNASPMPGLSPSPSAAPQKLMSVDRARTDRLNRELGTMKELKKVGVVVTGDTALVGYSPVDLTQNANHMKALISQKVKQSEPVIKNVVVSESADLMTRISKLTTSVTQKKPASEISTEISQLFKGLIPSVK